MSSNTPAIRPLVEIIDGQALTDSFTVADRFGKIHRDVIRAIENLDCSPEFRLRNFAHTQTRIAIHNGGHRHIKAYSITRDGFTFLAMGFTGAKAAQWKEAYIDAFNRMEKALREPVNQPTVLHPDTLRYLPLGNPPGQRYLIRCEEGGGYSAIPVAHGAYILTLAQIARGVGIGQDLPFSPAQLAQVIEGASGRLARVLGQGRQVSHER